MSNPDSSTPSIQALNAAVKPAGFDSWEEFMDAKPLEKGLRNVDIAFAYAADLDKADKVGREIQEVSKVRTGMVAVAQRAAALILPEPIDPDLLEAREMALADGVARTRNQEEVIRNSDGKEGKVAMFLAGIRRGRELAKEQAE